MKKILMVCTGNICRSPTADGVMKAMVEKAGLKDKFFIDSAGTHSYHVGSAPDLRTQDAAKAKGYDLSTLVSRKCEFSDYYEFDLILCMDRGHLEHLMRERPENATAEIALYLDYAGLGEKDVGDPYYGGRQGFIGVLETIEKATENLIKKLSVNN